MLHSWVRLDGLRYVDIAESGYHPVTDPTFQHPDSVTPVWPPFYPIIVRLASYLVPGDMAIAAVVVSNLASFGLLVVLYRLVERELGAPSAHRSVLCMLAFPTAFFLAMAYSESLFLLLTVGALYAARRNHWWLAGLLGAMSSATRVVGVLLVVGLAFEYMRQRRFKLREIRLNVLSLGLVPVGLLLYMAYLWNRFGDPLLFKRAQIHWGRSGIEMPWDSIAASLGNVHLWGDRNLAFTNLLDVACSIWGLVCLVLLFIGPWRLRKDQYYLAISAGLPFLAAVCQPLWLGFPSPLLSMNRYALSFFAMFLVMAKMIENRYVERLYLFTALPIQIGLMIIFVGGGWAG